MRPNTVILTVALLTIITGGAGWYHYTGTPQYSLAQLAHAVKSKDYETARYFVDEERIADSISKAFTDAVTAGFTKQMENDSNPFSGLGVAMMQLMLPRLRETTKEQVKQSVKEILSGNDTLTGKDGTKQADLRHFSGLQVKQCVVAGNTAEVLLGDVPQPNPFGIQGIRLRMARIPQSRNWRVVEAPDVARVFSKVFDDENLKQATAK